MSFYPLLQNQVAFTVPAMSPVFSVSDINSVIAKSYAIQVKGTGASPVAWDVRLEGSLNRINFSQILQHQTTAGDGAVLWSGSVFSPSLYFRINVVALTLGSASNIVVVVIGIQ